MATVLDGPELAAPVPPVRAPRGRLRLNQVRSLLGTLPFFAYVTVFLVIPTLVVAIGAFAGVAMAALGNGGSADDIKPGVDFFGQLKKAGNFLPVDPTSATVESGQTPVVFDWDYLNAAHTADNENWEVVVLDGVGYAGYYNQAINVDAPNPAAARLWQEFLYSDEVQNLWLKGGARPVRMEAMIEAGTIDTDLADALPEAPADTVVPTEEQSENAGTLLGEKWAAAVQ